MASSRKSPLTAITGTRSTSTGTWERSECYGGVRRPAEQVENEKAIATDALHIFRGRVRGRASLVGHVAVDLYDPRSGAGLARDRAGRHGLLGVLRSQGVCADSRGRSQMDE